MNASGDSQARLRRSVYAILIAVSVGSMVGRILAVNSVDAVQLEKYLQNQGRKDWHKTRPFLSANDRSRWATVRSLVERGTYAIDDIIAEPGWDTIDMVKHQGWDGQDHLYSSKPPLLATAMAGEYWLIHALTDATLGDHPYEIGRVMLVTWNIIPMLFYFLVLGSLAERFGTTDWGRLFMMAASAFGTFLTTFAVSINNHLLGAVTAAVTLWAAARVWYDGDRRLRWFALAGLFAALTSASELPALSLVAALGAGFLWKAPRETLLAYLPAAGLIAIAAVGTNYLAHGSLRPAYAHRTEGDNWYDYSYERDGKPRDSYWRHPAGIDKGEPSAAAYLLHCTIGHHGVFSLTPIWLLSIAGIVMLWRTESWRPVAALVGLLSLVCFAFYFTRPQIDRNYGGMTSGLRWMFWFTPLWLVALLPAADGLSRSTVRRGLGLLLLAFSVLSAGYPTWNPWTYPWLTNWMLYMDWIRF